jgi:hypothetical protein
MKSMNNFAYFLFGLGVMFIVYAIIFFQYIKQVVHRIK